MKIRFEFGISFLSWTALNIHKALKSGILFPDSLITTFVQNATYYEESTEYRDVMKALDRIQKKKYAAEAEAKMVKKTFAEKRL